MLGESFMVDSAEGMAENEDFFDFLEGKPK